MKSTQYIWFDLTELLRLLEVIKYRLPQLIYNNFIIVFGIITTYNKLLKKTFLPIYQLSCIVGHPVS